MTNLVKTDGSAIKRKVEKYIKNKKS